MQNLLEGKVILITGSSRGIGVATARLAKEYGAGVVLHGSKLSSELKAMADELNSDYVYCDVANEKDVQQQIETIIEKKGKIDALINCAGITNPKYFLEATEDIWLDIFKTNVLGTVNMCKAVIPHMQQAGQRRIVNISSIRGFTNTTGKAPYSTSKAAIVALTSSLAKEFGPEIAVNAVAPGFTNTEMSKTWSESVWAQAKTALVGRIADPSEIAEAILFLASDKEASLPAKPSLWMVGTQYPVNNLLSCHIN